MQGAFEKNKDNPTPAGTGHWLTASEERTIRHLFVVEGWKAPKIAISLNRSYPTVRDYIARAKLTKLRNRVDRSILENAVTANEKQFKEIIGLNTELIRRFLLQTLRADTNISVKDAKLASDIVANYWRLYQVIQGKPETINKNLEGLTPEDQREMAAEVLRMMREDPMLDIEFLSKDKDPGILN